MSSGFEIYPRWVPLLLQRGYPEDLINTTLSVPNLKQILMKNWHLIEKQPLLSEIYKKPALVSYKRGRSLKDILVRAKL